MKKRIKFVVTVLWILLSRSYDAFATYQYTPDLSHEANPLASVLNLGWSPILIIISLLTTYIIYAYYVSTFKKFPLLPKEKGYSFSEFLGYLYLGRKAKWTVTLHKLPPSLQRFNHYIGTVFALSLSFAGVVSTLMWLGINYTSFYKEYHSAPLIYGIIAVGIIIISYNWYKRLYKQYQLQTASE